MSEFSESNLTDYENDQVAPDIFLWQLEAKVKKTVQWAELTELPPEDYKQKLKNNVFWSNQENALHALAHEKKKWKKFTKQEEITFITTYKADNPIEERIDTAVDALHSAVDFLQSEQKAEAYLSYINIPELLAIMSKETNLNPAAEWTSWEKSYFHLTPDRKELVTAWVKDNWLHIPDFMRETTLGLLSFLMYKKKALERFSKIDLPKLADREKNRLVRLAHNKWISTTEKIVALAYAKYKKTQKLDVYAERKFDYVYQVVYEMAWFDMQNYQPRWTMQKQPSYQFLKLAVVDYGTVEDTATKPLSPSYPLSPYRASVALRYMLTIEALTDQLK